MAQLEAGMRCPRLPTLEKLADALRVSPAWLAFGSDVAWQPAESPRSGDLARRLRQVVQARAVSLRYVDRTANVSIGATRSVLAGGSPAIDIVEAIAKALSVSPAWLAFGLGPMELRSRGRYLPAPDSAARQDEA